MKKIVISVILLMLLFSGVAFAQANDLPDPGVLPDSPFYFLKNFTENVGTFFTFGEVAKAERYIRLSGIRLSEAKALADKGNTKAAEEAIKKYEDYINKGLAKAEEARANKLDVDEVLAKVTENTLKHQTVLADIYKKVPEQAKSAIERAMQASLRGHKEALKAISRQKRQEIMEKVKKGRKQAEQKLDELKKKHEQKTPKLPTKRKLKNQSLFDRKMEK
jgi:hypothetical protein